MNYGRIIDCDVANGPGMRISLFVSGCTHHCEGCFNADTWDFNYGMEYTERTTDTILEMLDKPYIQGISVLGGEPMEPENQQEILKLITAISTKFGKSKNIWIYSGYTFEELTCQRDCRACTKTAMDILKQSDILVDGEFIMKEKDVTLKFRGSRNQRIIDVAASLDGNTAKLSRKYE